MTLTPESLRCIVIFRELNDQQLSQLIEVFEQREVSPGEVLFRAGTFDEAFYLLTKGEVEIFEGEKRLYQLRPLAPIGELGALANLTRNTTATISQPSEVWKVTSDRLLRFFEFHADIAQPFYQNLIYVIADKVRRDQIRAEDMRLNIIRTQKAMKQMRDLILESKETPISEALHSELEYSIQHNRRLNYRVKPPDTMKASIHLTDGPLAQIVEVSRTHLSFNLEQSELPTDGDHLSGVLKLNGPELPISGTVLRTTGKRVDIVLDLLIDIYGVMLDGYLARVQMLDFMV